MKCVYLCFQTLAYEGIIHDQLFYSALQMQDQLFYSAIRMQDQLFYSAVHIADFHDMSLSISL